MSGERCWAGLSLVFVFLSGLLYGPVQPPGVCPATTPIGLDIADEIAADPDLPFRFPLNEYKPSFDREHAFFDEASIPAGYYHAAEDYHQPAGTRVYAIADGKVSYSAPAGGYGWLVIIDHPQANLYSLYGHLSPSRWSISKGASVRRGDCIAYLGDPDENGGSAENPLVTHLHFGLRAGQMEDYPSRGEWRYMAGWISLCPQDLGWLQPSRIITDQIIPEGGFSAAEAPFLDLWGFELAITLVYTLAGIGFFISAIRKRLLNLIFIAPIFVVAAGIVLHNSQLLRTPVLLVIGILLGYCAMGWAVMNSYLKSVRIM